MATLHIEHAITDLATWRAAFDRFGERRNTAGVVAHRIDQPVDDDHYVVIQLDFPTTGQALAFRGFLEAQVWSTPANSPGLAGSPRAVVLEAVDAGAVGPGAAGAAPAWNGAGGRHDAAGTRGRATAALRAALHEEG